VVDDFDGEKVIEFFCACDKFELWYVGVFDGEKVCKCGHPKPEHLQGSSICLGMVKIYQGQESW